ncbi:MAG: hypothetical protein GY778_00100 [bacterium]|nr:hypothetical protein [bacterium]
MQALVRAGYLNRKQLTCPGGGPFVFVPAAYEAPPDGQVNPRTVIAYEPLSNHGGEGGNILFADGHVEFVRAQACKALIQTATSQPVAD